jgi:hypothetical protein
MVERIDKQVHADELKLIYRKNFQKQIFVLDIQESKRIGVPGVNRARESALH